MKASPGFGGPKTLPGRIVAVVWMAASIVVIAIFTAGVTTVLTTRKLQGLVQEVSDLSSVRVGATSGTATTEYLSARGIRYLGYATPQAGLKALQAGAIDAFVYDKPLLLWVVEQEFSESIDVLDIDFDPQPYAVAFQRESKLREAFDVAMLDAIKSEWWKQRLSLSRQTIGASGSLALRCQNIAIKRLLRLRIFAEGRLSSFPVFEVSG